MSASQSTLFSKIKVTDAIWRTSDERHVILIAAVVKTYFKGKQNIKVGMEKKLKLKPATKYRSIINCFGKLNDRFWI